MSIRVTCPQCGKRHNVPSENAGKKFRCRQCEAVVVVPKSGSGQTAPKRKRQPGSAAGSSKPNRRASKSSRANAAGADSDFDDGFLDDLDSLASSEYGETALPPIPQAAKPKAKPKKRRPAKRVKNKTSGERTMGSRIGRGLLIALAVLIVISAIRAGIDTARRVVAIPKVEEWESVSVGSTGAVVKMPRKPQFKVVQSPAGPVKTWQVGLNSSAWFALFEPFSGGTVIDFNFKAASEAKLMALDELRSRPQIAGVINSTNVEESDGYFRFYVNTRNYLKGTSGPAFHSSSMYVIFPNGFLTLGYGTATPHSQSEAERFFGTLELPPKNSSPAVAGSSVAQPGVPAIPGNSFFGDSPLDNDAAMASREAEPGSAMSPTPSQPQRSAVEKRVSYQDLRRGFETKLLVEQPAPQKADRRRPGRGIEKVTYPSEGYDLLAFEYRGDATNDDPRPAILFLHGGFACDPNEIKAVQPFLDAGYVGLAPTYRGENNNPGSFSLFLNESTDAANAARWLADRPYVDADRVFCIGHSAGGAVAALLALVEDVPLRSTASVGGMYSVDDLRRFQPDGPLFPETETETRLRVMFGNIPNLLRPHFAYVGRRDFALFGNLGRLKGQATMARSKLFEAEYVDGDHFQSFPVGLSKYLGECEDAAK